MKMFRAVGFGILLLILYLAMPEVFQALEKTLLKFFELLQTVLAFGEEIFEEGSNTNVLIPASVNLIP